MIDFENDGRDYTVYVNLMSDDAVIEDKYSDMEEYIREGTIVDDGCGDGALLARIAEDYPESRLVGIEISEEMYNRCKLREQQDGYGDAETVFLREDITTPGRDVNDVDTVISSSICHELWSYGDGKEELVDYFEEKYRQLRPGGRLIMRDVIGPERMDEQVWAWFDRDNGVDTAIHTDDLSGEELQDHLDRLSTDGRFRRFLSDFEHRDFGSGEEAFENAVHETVTEGGMTLYRVDLPVAIEFMTTKDYTDNWRNEMQEEFTFWTPDHYREVLEDAGFDIVHLESYTNPWIEENRFQDETLLFDQAGDDFVERPFPDTNIIAVGEKPRP